MQVNEISTLQKYADKFQPSIPKMKQGKYVQIAVLRETKSHAIFTTEGQTLDVERLQAGIEITTPIDRIIMYKRKQVAPERRTGKALMRQFGLCPDQDITNSRGKVIVPRGECQLMGQSCGICPDCILYGFAAMAATASQRARVLTDSGFVVREQSQVMRDIKLNAIQETTAGGIAGSAYAHRENLLPQVFLPTVETLVDVTAEELVYVLGNILKTTRYGAESGREGFVRNHIMGIYFSDVEIFSNLELTQMFYDALAVNSVAPEYLALKDFTDNFKSIAEKCMKRAFGCIVYMTDEEITNLLADVMKLYGDEQSLDKFLRDLHKSSKKYATAVKGAEPSEESETEEEE